MSHVSDKAANYRRALARLESAALEQNLNEYVYDSVILRFEVVSEMAWKLIRPAVLAWALLVALDDVPTLCTFDVLDITAQEGSPIATRAELEGVIIYEHPDAPPDHASGATPDAPPGRA